MNEHVNERIRVSCCFRWNERLVGRRCRTTCLERKLGTGLDKKHVMMYNLQKGATPATRLIIKGIRCNKNSNRPATDLQHFFQRELVERNTASFHPSPGFSSRCLLPIQAFVGAPRKRRSSLHEIAGQTVSVCALGQKSIRHGCVRRELSR